MYLDIKQTITGRYDMYFKLPYLMFLTFLSVPYRNYSFITIRVPPSRTYLLDVLESHHTHNPRSPVGSLLHVLAISVGTFLTRIGTVA